MDRLTVLCFAGTYALALLAELARFATPADRGGRGARLASVGLAGLGWGVHTAYLVNLAWQRGSVPLTTTFESRLLLAWVLGGIALYLIVRPGRTTAAGPVVLALILSVLALAGNWRGRSPEPSALDFERSWLTFWGVVHGVFLTLGAVCTCLAFAFGLMYLVQSRRLKLKRLPGKGFALPSLEQSERWNRAAITTAFPLLTAGLLIGVGLMVATRKAGGTSLGWTDPKVLSTVALWVIYAWLLFARFRPEWRGRRVMVLTMVAFAFLAVAMFGVGRFVPTAHRGLGSPEADAAAPSSALADDGRPR